MKKLANEEYAERFGDRAEGVSCSLFLAEASDISLPERKVHTHKYSYGRALILAGSTGYSGAPVLAANACEKSGAGLTHLIVPESIYAIAASRCDGAVVTPCPASDSGSFSPESLSVILPLLKKADACVIGPGLGTGDASATIVEAVIRAADCPLILDADALTVCARNRHLLSASHSPVIITPHEGEFTRLGGDLSSGRLSGALNFASAFPDLILILKGYGTLTVSGEKVTVNPTGGPAMAKGGSGDVLCGILCALLAQGMSPYAAAYTAVYLHGLAGDLACKETGEYSLTPSDITRFLPKAFQKVMIG